MIIKLKFKIQSIFKFKKYVNKFFSIFSIFINHLKICYQGYQVNNSVI